MSERIRDLVRTVAGDGAEHLDPVRRRLPPAARGLAAIQREIAEEIAVSLGRAGRRVEQALTELRSVAEELELADAASRARIDELARRYNETRDVALLHLRDLKIQREALGFRRHDDLDRLYPIPPPRSG